jgi:tetratricopeptide (TPR) repeat protein
MTSPLPSPSRGAARRTLPGILAAVSLLFSCLAPARAPEKVTQESEPLIPYESIAASVALGNPQEALQSYEAAVRAGPQSREARILHARLLILAGKLDEAREELELLLAGDRSDAPVLYSLSVVEGVRGNHLKQKALLERAVEAEGTFADALAALGDLTLEEKDLPRAQELFRRALEQDGANLVALLGQAAILAKSRDYAGAAELCTRAIAAQPGYPFSYIDRARVRKSLGDVTGAIRDLTAAVSLDPAYAWSYIDRGKLYVQSGETAQALEDFSVAIKLDDSLFEAYALRAELQYRGGKDGPALADYERLMSLRPDYYFAYAPLGVLYMLKGDWRSAEKFFREALTYQEDAYNLALLAALAMRRGERQREAAGFLQGIMPQMPRESWEYEVARFLIDPTTDFSLNARIDRERNKAVRARMLYYVASVYLAARKMRPALSYLLEIEKTGAAAAVETRLAAGELVRLTAQE